MFNTLMDDKYAAFFVSADGRIEVNDQQRSIRLREMVTSVKITYICSVYLCLPGKEYVKASGNKNGVGNGDVGNDGRGTGAC